MHPADRQIPSRPAVSAPRKLALGCCLVASLMAGPLACPTASAQNREPPPLVLAGVTPGGARTSLTESWGTLDFKLTNPTGTDRLARVLVFFEERPDVQYGRDVWVPARSTLSTWMPVGPALQGSTTAHDMQVLLYDRSEGKERLILPPTQERIRSRSELYRKREPFTAIMLDDGVPDLLPFGQLPPPDSRADEAVRLTYTARSALNLSGFLQRINPDALPPAAETFDGIDHFVLASGRIGNDLAGMRALRQWLQQGGKVWVMLDMVEPEVIAPLLGDALDFQVVDRVSLTNFKIETQATGTRLTESPVQEHERPVEFVRVLLPPQEKARRTIDGWPIWFTRQVGLGKVVFTTLGARGWYRPRIRTDPPSPYDILPTLPVPTVSLENMAFELQPPPEEDPFRIEAFRQPLTEEIGYAVLRRGTVGLVFGISLLVMLGLGLALKRSHRPELLGWVGPAAALAATGVFLVLGESSRRAVPPTVAVAQVVDAVGGTEETPVHGLLAVHWPDSGPALIGAGQGGFFDPEKPGIEGRTRRQILTDVGSWHWENLALTADPWFAPFRYPAPTAEPITAVARLGPEGIEGRVAAGLFRELADALVSTPSGRNLAVRLGPDDTFRAGSQDVLPPGQFLAGTLLNDRQQRRQQLYREFLKRPGVERLGSGNLLLAWAQPIDMHFTLAPDARMLGTALLIVPLRLERPAPGARVTIPGPLIPYQRILERGPVRPSRESNLSMDMHLRFQLPTAAWPLKVERARLSAKINAPSRRVTIAGQADGRPVEIHRVESPLDPIRIDITEERLLHVDEEGGLHLNLSLSEILKGAAAGQDASQGDEKWTIEYLELEVTGQTSP